MAYGILNTFFKRAAGYGDAQLLKTLGAYHISLESEGELHRIIETEIPSIERPAMLEIPEYRERFRREGSAGHENPAGREGLSSK